MKKITIGFFIAMCLVQWLVPAKMIYDSENLLREGIQYRFRTLPIDPSDPFRGKYITLNFEANSITLTDSADWKAGDVVFVSFTTDSAGFAQADVLYRDEPPMGSYLKTTVRYTTTNEPFQVFFELPFNRFYLEESKAPQAEQVYLNSQRDSTLVTYALVNIGKGTALLKDVMINDKSIVEVVNELNEAEN